MQLKTHAERAARALISWWDDAGADIDLARALAARAQDARRSPRPEAAPPSPAALRPKAPPTPVEAARAAAAGAHDLAALEAEIRAFQGCALAKPGVTAVTMDGVVGAPVLVVGDAPRAEEDGLGRPFVGAAGQLLDQMLKSVGLSRQTNVLTTNCVYWRPPGDRTPTQEELAVCRPFVERLIALSQPKMLVLAGGVAAQTLLNVSEGVTRARGRRFSYHCDALTTSVNAMVILHPTYLLRQPLQKRLAWADLLALEAWLDELGAPRDARP